MSEGAKGGEFYTPISIVKLIVEVIEPLTSWQAGAFGHLPESDITDP